MGGADAAVMVVFGDGVTDSCGDDTEGRGEGKRLVMAVVAVPASMVILVMVLMSLGQKRSAKLCTRYIILKMKEKLGDNPDFQSMPHFAGGNSRLSQTDLRI